MKGAAVGVVLFMWGFILCIYTAIIGFMALWTQRNLDFILALIVKHPVDVGYWWSFAANFVFSPFALGFNVISEIIRIAM